MSDLRFQFEWEDPQGARGPELRATWARLTVLAGDTPVTRLIDTRSRSVRAAVYGPLYPVAEWIAMNWWRLLHEVETPATTRWPSYASRHSLAAAGEGFALPDLRIVPSGKSTDLRWSARPYPKAGVAFVEEGALTTDTASVRHELAQFVTAVVARLESEGLTATPLHDEWQAIQSADPEESAFCEAAAALGEDPFAMDDAARARLIAAADEVRHELLGEFLAATDFPHLVASLRQLNALIDQVSHSSASLPALAELRQHLGPPAPTLQPWHQGYETARNLRARLGLNGHLLSDDPSLANALHCDPVALAAAILSAPSSGWGFDALVGPAADGHPAFVTSKRRGDSQRFAFCRGLYEYLTAPDPQTPALVSRAHSDRQRANRAFAAEFLAPESLLRQRIEGDTIDEEQVDDLAAEFGVSSLAIRHQLENHSLAAIVP